jgi:eukaryotic-like serine/threonine-protein kinase
MNKLLILFLMSVALSAHGQGSSTAMFHGCDDHCGNYSGGKGYKPLGDLKWKYTTSGKIFSSPAIAAGISYVGSEDGNLYAIDARSGKLMWKFKTGGAVHSSPAVYDNTVFFGSFDGYYYAVNATSGEEKWHVKTGGERCMGGKGYVGFQPADHYHDDPWDFFLSSPVFKKTRGLLTVYFGSSDGNLYAVDATNGTVLWKFRTGGSIHTTPLVEGNTVYIGSWDASLYAIDTKTGVLRWKFDTGTKTGMTGIQGSPVVEGELLYFGARDAKFYCLNAKTGKPVWVYDAEGSWVLSTPAVKDGVVYVGTSDTFLLLGLDALTGKEKMRFKTHGYVYGSPAIAGTTAYFGDFTGKFFALDLRSAGKVWSEFATESRLKNAQQILNNDQLDFVKAAAGSDLSQYANNVQVMEKFYRLGAIVSSAVVDRSILYFGCADGNLYAIGLE